MSTNTRSVRVIPVADTDANDNGLWIENLNFTDLKKIAKIHQFCEF